MLWRPVRPFISFVNRYILGPIDWTLLKYALKGRVYDLTPSSREHARELMSNDIYLWVSRRDTHLSTYLIGFSDYVLSLMLWIRSGRKSTRPRFGYWGHAFLNYDRVNIVEAVGRGVQKVLFDEVFDCDAVAALLPKHLSIEEWQALYPKLKKTLEGEIGKPYDNYFDLTEDKTVSCIELVRHVLRTSIDNYEEKFKDFEAQITTYRNLTPQMLWESKDFVVIWEVRKK